MNMQRKARPAFIASQNTNCGAAGGGFYAFGISVQDLVDERRSAASECSAAASNTGAEKLDLLSHKTGLPDGMGMNIASGSMKVQQQAAAFSISVQDLVDERRSAASECSAAASNTRAEKLDLLSHKTGLPDGMGMNIAGGSLKVQQQAAAFGISVQDLVDERRSAVASCGGAGDVTARDILADELGVFSSQTGDPDGFGMKIAGGYRKVQEEAAALGISVQDKVDSDRYMVAMRGGEASGLKTRGQRTPNVGRTSRNESARVLGHAVGALVMGPEDWAVYITRSAKKMQPLDKPLTAPVNAERAKERPSGERDGWVILHAAVSTPRWLMTDWITYRLPSHTKEVPDEYTENVRDAISDAYHHNWKLHSNKPRK